MEINKRFDRVMAIFIQLQSKKIVTGQELAARFDVSLRTIYRDIRSLESAGIPIYSESGVGYSLVDGFRMAPAMFTKEEALSFGVAEKLMKNYLDRSLSNQFSSALYKMKAMLRAADKEVVSGVEDKVLMVSKTELFNEDVPEGLSVLFRSISMQQAVVISYQSLEAANPVKRTVEPVGVFHENKYWYFVGYCHLRQDYRQFRLDRVYEILLTDDSFLIKHQPLEFYLQKEEHSNVEKIVVSVDRDIVKYLKWERDYYGFQSEVEKGDQVEMTFFCDRLESGFARWYMMFGDCATILEPERLREVVFELIQGNLQKMEKKT